MEQSQTVQCPYCGQMMGLIIDTSAGSHRLTTDCEVCCRPFDVIAECVPGEVLNLQVFQS
jgi:hypothetical protein